MPFQSSTLYRAMLHSATQCYTPAAVPACRWVPLADVASHRDDPHNPPTRLKQLYTVFPDLGRTS